MRRRWLLLSTMCLLVPALAGAQSLRPDPAGPAGPSVQMPLVPGSNSITQSLDTSSVIQGNSVSCNPGAPNFFHEDNSYIRRFLLAADHGIVNSFTVTGVDFAIENSVPAGPDQPLTLNLYQIPVGAPLVFGNLELIGSLSFSIPEVALIVSAFPAAGTVPDPTTHDLVVEIFTPNGQTAGHKFFVGSNPNGQTAPSYLAAAECGITEPTDLVTLGFPDMHIIMVVRGDEIFSDGFESGDTSGWSSTVP